MNIVYTLNNKFIPQVGASITSICENNKSTNNINFYLLHTDITKNNQQKIVRLIKKYNRSIYFVKINELKSYFDFNFDTNGWNPIVLARLLIDKLLPKNINKVLYLDGDTITRGSLEDLWNIDIKNHSIAASIEPTVDKARKNNLDLQGLPYYNAGVLLINLKKWRENKIGEEIITYYQHNSGQLFANDQDAINASQKNNIYTLSPKYNFYNIFYQYPYHFLARLCDFKYIDKKTFQEAKQNPTIIHYLGEERPWRIGNKHKYKNDYLKYLNMTPWKGEEMEKGWKLYFLCWNFFNMITKPFPKLRYTIINALIPSFMKIRSKKLIKNHEK